MGGVQFRVQAMQLLARHAEVGVARTATKIINTIQQRSDAILSILPISRGGSTSINTDYDITGAVCKANEVATAACFSGSDADCAVPNAGNARNVVECRTLVSNAWQTGETPVWSNEFMETWWGSTWKGVGCKHSG